MKRAVKNLKGEIERLSAIYMNCHFVELTLTDINRTEVLVLVALKSLNASKSPGPDSIHPRILKESVEVITLPLSLISMSSLSSGMIPEKWKWAHRTPVFKKGSKHEKENYRPISLTSIICRLLERIIKNEIVKHLDANEFFSNDQYGFRAKRSCVTHFLDVRSIGRMDLSP